MNTEEDQRPRRRLPWVAIVVAAVVVAGFSFPPGRGLLTKFMDSLRVQKPQVVNVNLSSFVGPNANQTLQQMVSQMISDKVTTTVNENAQPAADVSSASQLAHFSVRVLRQRKDAPTLTVNGEHAFTLTIDRARLQEVFKAAGRADLTVPASLEGANVAVRIPRTVRIQYGECPGRSNPTANVATPAPSTTQYSNCVILHEGPSPTVEAPAGLNLEQLAQTGLEVAGMNPSQARQFLETVNWKSTLGISIPRFMRSYQVVRVDGVQGTLLDMAGRRGPTYVVVWAKDGVVYTLTGYGDSGGAVSLANALQ